MLQKPTRALYRPLRCRVQLQRLPALYTATQYVRSIGTGLYRSRQRVRYQWVDSNGTRSVIDSNGAYESNRVGANLVCGRQATYPLHDNLENGTPGYVQTSLGREVRSDSRQSVQSSRPGGRR